MEAASRLAEQHFEAIMDVRTEIEQSSLYYPDRDFNFLLWTLLPLNFGEQAARVGRLGADYGSVVPLRKDGGRYIAYAELKSETHTDPGYDISPYQINGPMTRSGGGSLYLWQLNTYWSDRDGWQRLRFKDAQACYAFWNGELGDEQACMEEYAFLLAKQYIVKTDTGFKFNAVWVDRPETAQQIAAAIPDLSKAFAPVIQSLYEQMLLLAMRDQPRHLEPQIAYMTKLSVTNGAIIPYILKHLLDNQKLRGPLDGQRKTITTWMGLIK
ncbi:hypothetical protein ACFQ88_25635 [Paenibacillus sp. NPDC056579]|uniref:hypothetical protein n=1 Tax=Paenibacillus sp. NPDC056579 TaxID=3345871 RepID=UPI0036C49BE5